MPGPVTDARAYELRERYHGLFAGDELPVPVDAIAGDRDQGRVPTGDQGSC